MIVVSSPFKRGGLFKLKKTISMKKMFYLPNLTGNIYLCLSSKSEYLDDMDDFKEGSSYREALLDMDGFNQIRPKENVLLLISENNIPLYVDNNDFVLLNNKVKYIELGLTCLN